MRRLEDLKIGHRIMLTVAIVVILLILLAAFGYLSGRWDEARAQYEVQSVPDVICSDVLDFRDQARRLMAEGLDEALKGRVQLLFDNWMKDATDISQPARARNGMKNAAAAYLHARGELAAFEIHPCTPGK